MPGLEMCMPTTLLPTDYSSWKLERRSDGAVLVRVPPQVPLHGNLPVPDAVFTFKEGDPQYAFWDLQLRQRERGDDR